MDKNNIPQFNSAKNTKSFGCLPNGVEVFCYTIHNKNGCEFSVINYGATIASLKITNTIGNKIDVVLGFDHLQDYINSFSLPSPPYFGTSVGRTAGRISNAQFTLNETLVKLNKNHGEHNLHGGNVGFSQAFWNVIDVDSHSISLQYISQDNEENFPGELTTTIKYTLTDDNEFVIETTAITTDDTIVNLTHHSYFNLDGHAGDVSLQKLQVNSDRILEVDGENIPTGQFVTLKNHAFDYATPKNCPSLIDNTFVLQSDGNCAASLFSDKNNLKMSVFTNQPAVHIYVGGNCFNQIKGKENVDYNSVSGICFETQNYPDAPHHQHFPSAVLKKDETYLNHTLFKFENILSK